MRHAKKIKKLGRTSAHRKATMAAMSSSLLEHKRITTTLPKAKALRSFVEPIINRAKEDSTQNRRQAFRRLRDKEAVKMLFGEVADVLGDRPGGYTRIVKLGQRAGDAAEMAIIELVDFNDVKPEGAGGGKKKTRRSRRKSSGASAASMAAAVEEAVSENAEAEAEETVESIEDEVTDAVEEAAAEIDEAVKEEVTEAAAEVEEAVEEATEDVVEVETEVAAEEEPVAEATEEAAPEAEADEASSDEADATDEEKPD